MSQVAIAHARPLPCCDRWKGRCAHVSLLRHTAFRVAMRVQDAVFAVFGYRASCLYTDAFMAVWRRVVA